MQLTKVIPFYKKCIDFMRRQDDTAQAVMLAVRTDLNYYE